MAQSKRKPAQAARRKAVGDAQQSASALSLGELLLQEKKYLAILALLAVLLYSLSVNNGYNLDDYLVTKDHPFVSKGISGIPEILSNPYYNREGYRFDYRPIAQVTFAVEQSLFGQQPGVSHFINVLLYGLLCAVLFLVLRYIFPRLPRMFLWLSMILFVVHPLHAEVVNNLKSRDEILSLLFGLGFLWAAVTDLRTPGIRHKVLAFLFLLLAMLSKVSILPLVLFIPLYALFFRTSARFRVALWVMPAVYIFFWLGYFIVVNGLLFPTDRPLTFTEMPLPANPTMSDKLGVIVPTIFFYVKMMVAPWPLSSYYGYNTLPFTEWKAIIVLAFLLLSLLMFSRGIKDRRFSALLPAWFIVSGVLYYNIGYYYTGIVSERAAFIMSVPGSIGLVMLVGALVQRSDMSRTTPSRFTTYTVYGIAVLFGLISFQRIPDWKDQYTLVKNDLSRFPESAHLNHLMGVQYDLLARKAPGPDRHRAYIDSAFHHFNKTLSLDAQRTDALPYVGRYYIDYYANLDSAYAVISRAWSMKQNGEIAYELARIHTISKRWDDALPLLEFVTNNDTSIHWAWYFLAQAYYEKGRVEEAFAANDRLLKYEEMRESHHLNAAIFYGRLDNMEKSAIHMREAVVLGNRDPRLLQALRGYYGVVDDREGLQWLEGLE